MAWYNPADPKQRNWMLGGMMCLVLVVPFRMYLLAPRQEANAEVETMVEDLERLNRQAELESQRGGADNLRARNADYRRHVAKLEELIPGREEVSILYDDVATRARLLDVEVTIMLPEPPQAEEYYDRTAYNMSVVGEYHDVSRFLTEIASLTRIVTPREVDIQLFTQPQLYPEMESPVLATFRIETYVLPDRSSQPPAVPTGGGA